MFTHHEQNPKINNLKQSIWLSRNPTLIYSLVKYCLMQLVGVCLVSFLLYTVLACLVSHTLMVPSSLLLVAMRCGTELLFAEEMHLAWPGLGGKCGPGSSKRHNSEEDTSAQLLVTMASIERLRGHEVLMRSQNQDYGINLASMDLISEMESIL
jgi:hypothetical protein